MRKMRKEVRGNSDLWWSTGTRWGEDILFSLGFVRNLSLPTSVQSGFAPSRFGGLGRDGTSASSKTHKFRVQSGLGGDIAQKITGTSPPESLFHVAELFSSYSNSTMG